MNDNAEFHIWPEWGSSSICKIDAPFQPTAGSMVAHDALHLPQALEERFDCRIEWLWNALPDTPTAEAFDWTAFDAEGHSLAADLKTFLGPEVGVEYRAGTSPTH